MITGRHRPKIRPPRRGITSDDVDYNTTWNTLKDAFTKIHEKEASNLSYEELYRFAYRLVLKKQGERLYDNVKSFEAEWLQEKVQPQIISKISSTLQSQDGGVAGAAASANERREAGERFLTTLRASWNDHVTAMNMLADVLMYMDRVYCADTRKPNIYVTAMNLFRDHSLLSRIGHDPRSPSVLGVLSGVVLDQIQMERAGDVINKSIIKSCIYMLDGLYESNAESADQKLYNTTFEAAFLNVSRDFYRAEGARLLQESHAGGYCERTMARLKEEQDRCRSMLSDSTTPKIEKVVEEELIKNKIREVIEMESGVRFMIQNDRMDELGLIYQLESRVDSKKPELTKALQERVVEMGKELNNAANAAALSPQNHQVKASDAVPTNKGAVAQTEAAIKWVADVLELKDKFDAILNSAFEMDSGVGAALTRSFSEFINSPTFVRSSEFISLFADENMKRGIKDKSEAEIDEVLQKAITLVRYIQNKDMFEQYYKRHLMKRLIQRKSVSMDVEKDMVSRMKIELGNQFTQKMEGMFKDIQISGELSRQYATHMQSTGSEARHIGLDIQVLTSMTWPHLGDEGVSAGRLVIYPPELERVRKSFERFYGEKHSGRELTWLPHLGTADLRARYGKQYEVNIPVYGMLVLLLFNDVPAGEYLSFEEIQARTNIPEDGLKRNLQTISVAKRTQFLLKEPMSREVSRADRFCVNEKFSAKFFKLKVGIIANSNRVETDQERKDTEEIIDQHRGVTIEAAIVRIMKQRKELPHQQLVVETLEQLKVQFRPDVNMIKKRIESLIDREYIERVEGAKVPSYRYMA